MWKTQLRGILDRLERLESSTNLDKVRDTLGSTKDAIDALRASQADLSLQVAGILNQFNDMKHAVAEGIERTDRAERRIAATVKRARKELAESGLESPGLESENHELRLFDGAGSEERGVQPVPEEMAEPASQASSIRGVSIEQLRRAQGR